MSTAEQRQIVLNVRAHDAVAETYEDLHREIFSGGEQARLATAVALAVGHIKGARSPIAALDVGCGSGNVTRRLLNLGAAVTAADVSSKFLELCERKYAASGRLSTLLL